MNKNAWIVVGIVVILAAVGWYVTQKRPGAQSGGEQIKVQSGSGVTAPSSAESDSAPVAQPPALPN